MSVEICAYQPALDAVIIEFFAAARAADAVLPRVSADAWGRFVAGLANHGPVFLVGCVQGQVAGVATSSLREDGLRLRHLRIITLPAHRRQGVGRALLEALRRVDQPAVTLQTLCPASWGQAQRFYQQRGFQEVQAEVEMSLQAPAELPLLRGWVTIEPAAPRDFPRLCELHGEAYRGSFGFRELSVPELELQAGAPGARFLVGRSPAGEILGFCQLADEAGGLRVESLVVGSVARRRGVGRELLRAALASAQPGQQITLGVNSDNTAAQLLYRSFGFEEQSRTSRLRWTPGASTGKGQG